MSKPNRAPIDLAGRYEDEWGRPFSYGPSLCPFGDGPPAIVGRRPEVAGNRPSWAGPIAPVV
ncbi:hypothetical protein CROQUDRAFT_94977 [Cronartium quercuum f. sp. fusiforme G11]|uniref:Uncharacterized protein n=1 Tax=Cronartium quercuum f. sp. fusiforme G11 TaxID=708437 RepID=A0A9P6ND30_9BASI|nr:hypothetical protein CROQUDRAFT_94977 [Cronartium quercuum f. sp. fusiforme G11]